jgi:hypothetical protein
MCRVKSTENYTEYLIRTFCKVSLLQDSPPSLTKWKALTHILGNGYSQGRYKTAMSAA